MWWAAIFCSIALLDSLFIQSLGSVLAGAWVWLFLCGCAILCSQAYPKRELVGNGCLFWLGALGTSCFIIQPPVAGSISFFILAAMPTLALCLHKEDIKPYIFGFGAIVTIYALGLIYQQITGMHYTVYNTQGEAGRSWPMLDPNNAAAVINCALIPCFYRMIQPSLTKLDANYGKQENRLFSIGFFLLFLCALILTHSRAGYMASAIACFILAVDLYGEYAFAVILGGFLIGLWSMYLFWSELLIKALFSFSNRIPIWEASLQILNAFPLRGVGLGMFGYYYKQITTDTVTSGWYAHNDILQFAIEMGIPFALSFLFLIFAVLRTTNRDNLIAACVLLAVLIQSMVEQQFYVPAVSILAGLALAYHRCYSVENELESRKI